MATLSGNKEKRDLIIASLGRCGSTLLDGFFRGNFNDSFSHICKTHNYPHTLAEEFDNPIVIFLFGDPVNIIKSLYTFLHMDRVHYGNLVYNIDQTQENWEQKITTSVDETKGLDFLRVHAANLNVSLKDSDFENMVVKDIFCLENMFDAFYKTQEFDMVTVRFETLWENIDKLLHVIGLESTVRLPDKKKRFAEYIYSNKELLGTYESLSNKIQSAENFKVWLKEEKATPLGEQPCI